MGLEADIKEIKERNARVEEDKEWETSLFRKATIGIVTYIIIVLFLQVVTTTSPYVAALVPVIGYLLSTLTLPMVKRWWTSSRKKRFEK